MVFFQDTILDFTICFLVMKKITKKTKNNMIFPAKYPNPNSVSLFKSDTNILTIFMNSKIEITIEM